MASVRKHGNKWQARISRKGCAPIAKSFLSKVDAERWSRQAEAQLDQGTFVDLTEAQKTTIGELIERYRLEVTPKKKGTKQEGYRLNVLKRSKLARLTLATTRSADIARYRDERIAVVADLAAEVAASLKLSNGDRVKRLADAPKVPERIQIISVGFRRNADVIVTVLLRANGVCEMCKANAPFLRRSDGSPYLEVHHSVPLGQGGQDTVENAVALCPNCHREVHHA